MTQKHAVTVLGSGAWGTAVAQHIAKHHTVCLWSRDLTQTQRLQQNLCNEQYLPGIALSEQMIFTSDLSMAIDFAQRPEDMVIVATPVAGLDALCAQLVQADLFPSNLILLCKGVEPTHLRLPHEIIASFPALAQKTHYGILSGPSFAKEVAQELPSALVAASTQPSLRNLCQAVMHSGRMRIYQSDDLVGVAIAGAVKNILAIAAGINDGLHMGYNSRAALLTRGLAEMTRLGLVLGGKQETFMGLAGMGDLILTATGPLSRNRQVGLGLAEGQALSDILHNLGHVAEGVYCAQAVVRLAKQHGVEMPISEGVASVLFDHVPLSQIVKYLLARDPKSEGIH